MSKQFYIRKTETGFESVKEFRKYLDNLPEGKYKITVEKSTKRSLMQNAWFHAVLPDILTGLREVGYSEIRSLDDAKDFVKALFFKKSVSNGIDTVEIIEGTSSQSKINFSEKAEDIIIWASEYLGIDVSPPSKQFEIFV